MITCPKCGKTLPDNARFCTGCRYPIHTLKDGDADPAARTAESTVKVDAAPGPDQAAARRYPLKRIFATVAVGLFLVGAAIGGVSLVVRTRDSGAEADTLETAAWLLELGNYAECIDYTQDALRADADNTDLLLILGQAQAGQGDYEAAAGTFGQVDADALDGDALPGYIRAMAQSGDIGQASEALDRYLGQVNSPASQDAALLVEAAAAALQRDGQALLDRCIAELERWMDAGQTEPDWNVTASSALLYSALSAPSQESLEAAAAYYLKTAEQAGLTDAAREALADCYAIWRQTAADLLESDWACYQMLLAAAPSEALRQTVLDAYVDYLIQPLAQLDALADAIMERQAAGALGLNGSGAQPFCEAILQTCAAQNGSGQHLAAIEGAMSAENYRQAISLWEADPWLQGCPLWYQGGVLSLWPLDGASCLYFSPDGLYYGQTAGGQPNGAGVLLMRDSSGDLLYCTGGWAGGTSTAAWINLDQAEPDPAPQSASSSAASSAAPSRQTPPQSTQAAPPAASQAAPPASSQAPQTPPTSTIPGMSGGQSVEDMMRAAEAYAQSLLDTLP